VTNCPICDSILTSSIYMHYPCCSSNDHYFEYNRQNDFEFMVAIRKNYKKITSCYNYENKCNIYISGKVDSVIEYESVERTKENVLQKFNESKKALALFKVFQ
jgi:hypothetical protein